MKYYIGWDVGGWHCDNNPRSRDALCVLELERDGPTLIGAPWRGNLRPELNQNEGPNLVQAILGLCHVKVSRPFEAVIAIDTPLGWPLSATQLFSGGPNVEVPEDFRQNAYLFRETERFLSCRGFKPLSAVKDMIGSQSTKGLHFLRAIRSQAVRAGVWEYRQEDTNIIVIETYPSPCEKSATFRRLFYSVEQAGPFQNQTATRGKAHRDDVRDALRCAVIAWLYAEEARCLASPGPATCLSEGWIWIPQDAFG